MVRREDYIEGDAIYEVRRGYGRGKVSSLNVNSGHASHYVNMSNLSSRGPVMYVELSKRRLVIVRGVANFELLVDQEGLVGLYNRGFARSKVVPNYLYGLRRVAYNNVVHLVQGAV